MFIGAPEKNRTFTSGLQSRRADTVNTTGAKKKVSKINSLTFNKQDTLPYQVGQYIPQIIGGEYRNRTYHFF